MAGAGARRAVLPALRVRDILVPGQCGRRIRFLLWREWCFARFALRQIVPRLALLLVVLLGGGLLFRRFEPDKDLSWSEATFYTWSLLFGQPPEAYPRSAVLQSMFFVVPVLGLTVIIEGILNVSLLLRDRRRYERNWCRAMAASLSNHIILVGFGKLGYRVFGLLRHLGEPVLVIERDAQNRFLEELRRDGCPLILGDARDEGLLVEANIAKARSVIIATNHDLANLEIALDARRLKPGINIVMRMFDQNMADKIREGFDLRVAMSQSAMSAPAFAMAAVDPSIVNSFVVGQELIVLQRWTINADGPLAGATVGQVMTKLGCGVAEICRGDASPQLFPPPDAALCAGDQLLVQGPFNALNSLRQRLLIGAQPAGRRLETAAANRYAE
jgi:voltage-gated potassium channel